MCAMKLFGVWPDHEDVIDESFIVCGFEWAGVQYGLFQFAHECVGVWQCQFGACGYAEFLQVVFFIEFECVKFENHFL